jgi:FlaG protein
MTDYQEIRVEPTVPVRPAAPVRPINREHPAVVPPDATKTHHDAAKAAVTDGNLRAAYAQFMVNPDTHDTVIRIHDATTGEVLSETPSPEIQQMKETLKKYADTLARYKTAHQATAAL